MMQLFLCRGAHLDCGTVAAFTFSQVRKQFLVPVPRRGTRNCILGGWDLERAGLLLPFGN